MTWHAADTPRNRAIAERVRAGETCASVAADLGISRERVRQIALAFGVRAPHRGRPSPRVEWRCETCDRKRMLTPHVARARRFCSRACADARREAKHRTPDGLAMSWQPTQGARGQWVCTAKGRRAKNAARHIAELLIGRALTRSEQVTMLDGDPRNIDPANLVIVSQRDRWIRAAGGPWSYRTLDEMRANGGHP